MTRLVFFFIKTVGISVRGRLLGQPFGTVYYIPTIYQGIQFIHGMPLASTYRGIWSEWSKRLPVDSWFGIWNTTPFHVGGYIYIYTEIDYIPAFLNRRTMIGHERRAVILFIFRSFQYKDIRKKMFGVFSFRRFFLLIFFFAQEEYIYRPGLGANLETICPSIGVNHWMEEISRSGAT